MMLVNEPITWTGLGVGGALAGMMFYFYRLDRKSSEDQLTKLASDFRSVISENTRAITKLYGLLGRTEGQGSINKGP